MELKDTIDLMQSTDYKDRFKAEYYQLKIRLDNLDNFLAKIEAPYHSMCPEQNKKMIIHDCDTAILKRQRELMRDLLFCLKIRAYIENVNIFTE